MSSGHKLPNKRGKGALPHVPTPEHRKKIGSFSVSGFTHEEIAYYFDISLETLYKYYKDELTKTKLDKTRMLGRKVFRSAMEGDQKAAEFWLKSIAKWNPNPVNDKKDITESLLEMLQSGKLKLVE